MQWSADSVDRPVYSDYVCVPDVNGKYDQSTVFLEHASEKFQSNLPY